MEEKNNLLLTIIAIATLLVAVVGASFAYFSSRQITEDGITLNVSTTSNRGVVTSTASAMNLVIDGNKMDRASANPDIPIAMATSNLNISLLGDSLGTYCAYDIAFEWQDENGQVISDQNNFPYKHSPINNELAEKYKEFTLSLSTIHDDADIRMNYGDNVEVPFKYGISNPTFSNVGNELDYSNDSGVKFGNNWTESDEIDFADLSIDEKTGKLIIVKNAHIYNKPSQNSESNSTSVNWKINTYFYNIPVLQGEGSDDTGNISSTDGLDGKTFRGKFTIANIECPPSADR